MIYVEPLGTIRARMLTSRLPSLNCFQLHRRLLCNRRFLLLPQLSRRLSVPRLGRISKELVKCVSRPMCSNGARRWQSSDRTLGSFCEDAMLIIANSYKLVPKLLHQVFTRAAIPQSFLATSRHSDDLCMFCSRKAFISPMVFPNASNSCLSLLFQSPLPST